MPDYDYTPVADPGRTGGGTGGAGVVGDYDPIEGGFGTGTIVDAAYGPSLSMLPDPAPDREQSKAEADPGSTWVPQTETTMDQADTATSGGGGVSGGILVALLVAAFAVLAGVLD